MRWPELDRHWRVALRLVAIAGVIAAVVWANMYAAEHEVVRSAAIRFGYPGIFIAAAISGFNLVVPIPVIAFFPFFMEIGFAPVLTVLIIAVGMTTGDLVGYLLGKFARDVVTVHDHWIVVRFESLRERHPGVPFLVMFLYAAFAPLPNEILVMPMAFLRYPVVGIFVAVLAGNLIFNSLLAFGAIELFEAF